MSDTPSPWGPYRATIEDHLDSCADYLGRLRRSLAGEIARTATTSLTRPTSYTTPPAGCCASCKTSTTGSASAARPSNTTTPTARGSSANAHCAGHYGTHDDNGAGRLLASRITGELRHLADTVERISQHFAWSAPTVDRDLTDAPATAANSRDAPANLAVSLDTIGRRTTRLADKIRAIDLEPDTPQPGGAPPRCVPPPADPHSSPGL
jgi:hypothetical protein